VTFARSEERMVFEMAARSTGPCGGLEGIVLDLEVSLSREPFLRKTSNHPSKRKKGTTEAGSGIIYLTGGDRRPLGFSLLTPSRSENVYPRVRARLKFF